MAYSEGKRDKAALALARGVSVAEAARETRVPQSTLFRWRSEEDFIAHVREIRRELLNSAVGKLSAGAEMAVTTLTDALSDPDTRNRVQAARTLLDNYLSLRESVEFEERIAALEAEQAQKKRGAL